MLEDQVCKLWKNASIVGNVNPMENVVLTSLLYPQLVENTIAKKPLKR